MTRDDFEILTPEEFFTVTWMTGNVKGKRNFVLWMWPKLTSGLRKKYLEYIRNYPLSDEVQLYKELIKALSDQNVKLPQINHSDVIEAFFPYNDPPNLAKNISDDNETRHKTRPSVVIRIFPAGKRVSYLVAKITSGHINSPEYDLPIAHDACGLRKESHICLYSLASVDETGVIGLYGSLCETDQSKYKRKLREFILPYL